MSVEDEVAKLVASAANAAIGAKLHQRASDLEEAVRRALPHLTDAEITVALADLAGRLLYRRRLANDVAVHALATVIATRAQRGDR